MTASDKAKKIRETLPQKPDVIESQTDEHIQNDTESSSPSVLALISIICGMVIITGGVVFFALKRKK
jgi:hypothetical protein